MKLSEPSLPGDALFQHGRGGSLSAPWTLWGRSMGAVVSLLVAIGALRVTWREANLNCSWKELEKAGRWNVKLRTSGTWLQPMVVNGGARNVSGSRGSVDVIVVLVRVSCTSVQVCVPSAPYHKQKHNIGIIFP